MRVSRRVFCSAAAWNTFTVASAWAVPPAEHEIDRLAQDALAAWKVPGLALVVVQKGRETLLKGYGVQRLGTRNPVTPDTIFPLASCTKAFTSTLAGMLVDDGILTWDDLVQKHLPRFRLKDPNADALVSLRDLLSHRTGVKGHDLLWYHAPWPLDETLARVEHLPLDYPFRGGFEYSSIMYIAAGRTLEAACGHRWERLLRDRLLRPLRMPSVYVTTRSIPATAERATGHIEAANGHIEVMPAYTVTEPNPAGSIHLTARDLGEWLKFQLAGGTAHGKRLISEQSLRDTRQPQNIIPLDGLARRMNPDTHTLTYGMGWVRCDHRGKLVLAHGGVLDGFRAQVTFLPEEGVGFALLNNLHETRMNQALTNRLIDLYCALPPRDWNRFFQKIVCEERAEKTRAAKARLAPRRRERKPTLPPAGYVGSYENPAYGRATVTQHRGVLTLKWSTWGGKLEPWSGDVFRLTEGRAADQLAAFAVPPGSGHPTALRVFDQDFRSQPTE